MKAVCPSCRKKFPWDTALGYPKACPLCAYAMGHNRADDDIVIPFIRTVKTTQADKVYRDMEAASEVRAQQAADMAGVPVSEMADLKITDLRSTMRPGDVAAVPVNNAVSQLMNSAPPGVVGFASDMGLQFSANSMQGPYPSAGARMRTFLTNDHSAKGGPSSELPANETLQPGYVRRG
jgi:hypothetical protein